MSTYKLDARHLNDAVLSKPLNLDIINSDKYLC